MRPGSGTPSCTEARMVRRAPPSRSLSRRIRPRRGGTDMPNPVAVDPRTGRMRSAVRREIRWVFQRPRNLERIALAVQRISGVGLLAYLVFHIFVTGTVASGRGAWEGGRGVLSKSPAPPRRGSGGEAG